MERTVTLQQLQLPGRTIVTARQPKSACNWQERGNFINVLEGSSGVWGCGRMNGQLRLGLSVSHCCSSRIREPPSIRKLRKSVPSSSSPKRAERRPCSVLNEVGQSSSSSSSSQASAGAASPDELKNQLEALQDEALQVRNRYNNAKARFMRLTEVAQQLRQRASIDLNLGNEDGARKALEEKQKVIQAAELSKRRAQLLEGLSTKLGEAVSVKETQLIVALARPQRREPTVRVVSPTGEGATSDDPVSRKEGNLTDGGDAEASQTGHEVPDSEDPAAEAEGTTGASRQLVADSGDVFVEEETVSRAAELSYSTDRYLDGSEEDAEATVIAKLDSDNVNLPLGGGEWVRDDRDVYLLSEGSLSTEESSQGEPSTSGLHGSAEGSVSLNGSEDADGAGEGSSLREIDVLEQNDGGGEASRLLEELIVDVDRKVAGVELQLRTAVSGKADGNDDSELRLVRDLLERVQSLRARISEVAGSLTQQETQ